MQGTLVIDESVSTTFAELRMKRQHRWVIYRVADDNSSVIVDAVGERAQDFASFQAAMPKDQPRFAVYDLEFKRDDGRQEGKILFILYNPDQCTNGGLRFVYANAKAAVLNKASPVHKEFQINDHADLSEQEFISSF